MQKFDIVIIGGGFAGLTLAHYLPKKYNVLIVDQKKSLDAGVESTGLITTATYSLFKEFTSIDNYIPNRIESIAVISPNYKDYFFSAAKEPWIFSTDTPNLLKHMAQKLPSKVIYKTGCSFLKSIHDEKNRDYPNEIHISKDGKNEIIKTKFLVGADGAHSKVARSNIKLSQNSKFLAGLEKVFYGDILLGPNPEKTVYHFWFGEFSLGYGGWLSPTIINGKNAFRVGLAKLHKDIKDLKKLDEFIDILKQKKIITINKSKQPIFTFGSLIPIGGVLKNITFKDTMLIGDAAGFCGAFAADGIKGALVSGMVAAKLIPQYLDGDKKCLKNYKKMINQHQKLIRYYRKQKLYRFIWSSMKKNSTYQAMYSVIAKNKETFIAQFCDIKDKARSLKSIVLNWRNIPHLTVYALYLLRDIFIKKT